MLQYQRQVICLAILMLATPAAVSSQISQHEGSADTEELAITFPDAELADRMAARSFHVIPTTSVYRGTVSLHYIDKPIDLDDPFLRETVSEEEVTILRDPDFITRFRSRWQRPLAAVEDRNKAIELRVDELLANVGMLHERGVPIVLGTDTETLFSFAGYSVHDELEFLVKAGLTPGEALETGTRRAAEMLDSENARSRLISKTTPMSPPCAEATFKFITQENQGASRVGAL